MKAAPKSKATSGEKPATLRSSNNIELMDIADSALKRACGILDGLRRGRYEEHVTNAAWAAQEEVERAQAALSGWWRRPVTPGDAQRGAA